MAEFYGSVGIFDATIDYLQTLMTALIAQMVTDSTSPAISSTYAKHTVANMDLISTTVGVDGGIFDPSGWESGTFTTNKVQATIRVHTDYIGGTKNEQEISQLLDSINNYMSVNRKLSASFRIVRTLSSTVGDEFPESYTVGGSITFEIETYVTYTQL